MLANSDIEKELKLLSLALTFFLKRQEEENHETSLWNLTDILAETLLKIYEYQASKKTVSPDPYIEERIAFFKQDAIDLLRRSLEVARAMTDEKLFDKSWRDTSKHNRLLDIAFVSILNLKDLQIPTWPRIRIEHLDGGYSVVTEQKYFLYGQPGIQKELPTDINNFPRASSLEEYEQQLSCQEAIKDNIPN